MIKTRDIEDLVGSNGLISPVQYDEKSKDSFFSSIHEWSRGLGYELKEDRMNVARALGYISVHIYENLLKPNKNLSSRKQAYRVIAPLISFTQIPFLGMWIYRAEKRQIVHGNKLQKFCMTCLQGDPLVHEYLHAYEHLFCDFLLLKGLIDKPANPVSIIEPPFFRFYVYPPSMAYLRKFERRMLKILDLHSL